MTVAVWFAPQSWAAAASPAAGSLAPADAATVLGGAASAGNGAMQPGFGAAASTPGAEASSSQAAASPAVPTPPPQGLLPATAAAADGAAGSDGLDLLYGAVLSPAAWYAMDSASFQAAVAGSHVSLREAYNQWLAIADQRDATLAAGVAGPDGTVIYNAEQSAEIHALGLALWARERFIDAAASGAPVPVLYPPFASLGYNEAGTFVGGGEVPDTESPEEVAALIAATPVPPTLFHGVRIFLMPYNFPREYGLTTVVGPEIDTWLGAGASIDLRHVLMHELGHAVAFRYGGYDSVAPGQPLSAFWQQYLAIRHMTWHDPLSFPWARRTPECFAEDFAYIFGAPQDALGYEAACGAPDSAQQLALLNFWDVLPSQTGDPSPYMQSANVEWTVPWSNDDFGNFRAQWFTAAPSTDLTLALVPGAAAGPYTVAEADGGTLATLVSGQTAHLAVSVPPGGTVEVDADNPSLVLSSLMLYRNAAFRPIARISGVFSDTLTTWARAAIAAAVRDGIVGGYPDGTFRPEAPVTRGSFARMLGAALLRLPPGQRPAPLAQAFADVPATAWFAPFAAATGPSLPGVGPDFFPNRLVTWAQAVAWTAQALGWTSGAKVAALPAAYADVPAPDRGGFAAGLARGIVTTTPPPGASASAPITRAQAAVLVLSALAASGGGPSAPMSSAAAASG